MVQVRAVRGECLHLGSPPTFGFSPWGNGVGIGEAARFDEFHGLAFIDL
jgi:hypothetical protein